MIQDPNPVSQVEHVRRLEEALAEYASLYGLTPRARTLLTGRPPDASPPAHRVGHAARFPTFPTRLPVQKA